jgi:hydrogenase maturation protease
MVIVSVDSDPIERAASRAAAEAVARAVLYEGFVLYPYRSSSLKNRHRWLFGTLAPPGSAEGSAMRTECLLRGGKGARVRATVRFLQLLTAPAARAAPAGDGHAEAWADAIERAVSVEELSAADLCRARYTQAFSYGPHEVSSGGVSARAERVEGTVHVSANDVGRGAYRIRVDVENTTRHPTCADASLTSLASAHVHLEVEDAEFCSLADPPPELRDEAARCKNTGAWPALLTYRAVLSSAIVLPDFPAIATESPGDLFDATEIDEILTLRILALTDAEKEEVRRAGGRARALLERTESLGAAEMTRLHGALRARPARRLRPGDAVRIVPRRRGDAIDIALADRRATVVSVEADFEGATYVAVTIDDDPGADLGRTGQPGHRFFFHPDEVKPWT